jgi:hypothetical protein
MYGKDQNVMALLSFRMALPALLLLAPALPAEDLKPEAILDKYIEVTGGRAAYEKIQTQIATGTLELPTMGLSGALTIYQSMPDKSYTVIDLAGMGKAEEGSNGKVAWSNNSAQGPHIKEGDERAMALRLAALHAETRWQDFYKKAELAGTEDVAGKPCYKIVLTPNDGGLETRYYDKSSNLLVKFTVPVTTPEGTANFETGLADYRDEGGILMAHTITEKLPNLDIVVKIASVKYNPDIPASRYDLPDEIKAAMGTHAPAVVDAPKK